MISKQAPQITGNRKDVKLHSGQTPLFLTDARFCALIAGTGGGKTWVGPWWLMREILKYPGKELFGIGAPTHRILTRITIPALIEAFEGTDLQGVWKRTSSEYQLPTGGVIYLCSTDNPDHIEGGQYRAWWLDEAGQMRRWTWTVIQARLGYYMGRCLMTTTPYSLNWLYSEVYKLAQAGDPDYFVSQFASVMNPSYPMAEFNRAKRTMDERTFALRYLGEFRQMAGLIYPDMSQWVCQESDLQAAKVKAEANGGIRYVGAVDWGYHNPFCGLMGFLDTDDVLWIEDEHYASGMLIKEHAAKLDKQYEYFVDPSGLQETNEFRACGMWATSSSNNFAVGVEKVSQRGKTGRLKISPNCKNLLSEAETYHYREGTDNPVKEDDHAMDSVRYIVMGVDGKASPAVINLLDDEDNAIPAIIESEDPRIWKEL